MRVSRCLTTTTLKPCLLSCPAFVVLLLTSGSTARGLVVPRKFLVMTDPDGRDWNSALDVCRSLNMTLATLDVYAFTFLVGQSLHREFQKNADGHFWIGLHHLNLPNETSAIAGYRWTDQCQANAWNFWDDGYPGNASEDDDCVYAANTTLRWRADRCSSKHQYLCQRVERRCHYNQTLARCNLYITASERRTVLNGSPAHCSLLCETSYTDQHGLPCWGFTMTTTGCVLHYQASQPNCDVSHHQTYPAFFRTCFQMFYTDGPTGVADVPDTEKDIPDVQECGPVAQPEDSGQQTKQKDHTQAVATTEMTSQTQPRTEETTAAATSSSSSPPPPTTEQPVAEAASLIPRSQTRTATPAWTLPPRCGCQCDVTRRNMTSVLAAVQVTRQVLAVDVKGLSRARRKKASAGDPRVSSRSVAYIGVAFVTVVVGVVLLPDLATLARHVRHGVPLTRLRPRRRPCYIP